MHQTIRTSRNRLDVLNGKRHWFRVENRADDTADIAIFDEIGFFGIGAGQFREELDQIEASTINLHINSPGGDVFDGVAIHNLLKQHNAHVNVYVDGIAASIASVIAMAGDSVEMARGAMMMIHEPFAMTVGTVADHEKTARALEKMRDTIAGFYADRTGKADGWLEAMAAETWYTADEAVAAGLADRVSKKEATKNTFDLSIFRNGPRLEVEETVPKWQQSARQKVAAAMVELVNGYSQ